MARSRTKAGANSRAYKPGRRGHQPLANAASDALQAGGEPPVLRRFRSGFRWEYTDLEPYKLAKANAAEFAGASRQVLFGKRGERVGFHVRYFELAPGGYTSLERHRHSHAVIAVRGRGVACVGDTQYALKPMDGIYIGPDQAHQLRASGRTRFGFFCIVNARRDKPRPVHSK